MYEGFSGQARKAIQLAYREAERLRQEYLGTEHLLLGVLREGSPGVVRLLAALGTDPEKVYQGVEADLPRGTGTLGWDRLPLTPGAKRSLWRAREVAVELHHPCAGPEHLLLGAVHEADGSAAQLVRPLGITPERLRQELAALPEPDNRDWMLRPEATSGPSGGADPSAAELEAVVSAAPLPSADPAAPPTTAPPPNVPLPDLRLEIPVVERQLDALRVVVCALGGAFLGAPRLGIYGAVLAGFGGCLVGCVLLAAKSNFLARVLGLAAGLVCGWLYGGGNVVLALLAGGAGLVLGFCLGDWRKLMGPPPAAPEGPAKQTVESITKEL